MTRLQLAAKILIVEANLKMGRSFVISNESRKAVQFFLNAKKEVNEIVDQIVTGDMTNTMVQVDE